MSAVPHEATQQWPGELEDVPQCPVCGDARRRTELDDVRDTTFAAANGAWNLKRCLGCSAAYLDPRPSPGSIQLAYRDYYTHVAGQAGPRSAPAAIKHALANGYRNRIFGINVKPALAVGAWVAPLFPAIAQHIREEDRGIGRCATSVGRVLDVGCGNGYFLQVAQRLGWLSYGVDADATAAAQASRCGSVLGAHVQELDERYDRLFDVVTLGQVIEHVHDPFDTLRHCWRVLKPGGYVWMETPNMDSAGYEFYGRYWRGLEAPRHLVLFNPRSLRSCLERAGFERIQILPPRDAAEYLFTLSAAMQLGRIVEQDRSPLPLHVRQNVKRAVAQSRDLVRREPGRSEFVAAVAYRPSGAPAFPGVRAT